MEKGCSPTEKTMEEITLQNDTGSDLTFMGTLFAEHSYFDEENNVLTRQCLYSTAHGHKAYSIVSSSGTQKERRAYLIKTDGRLCRINNGLFDVTVKASDLLLVVRGLCGISETVQTDSFFSEVEEALKSAAHG